MIGDRLGHFRITATLGEGGMGEVYRADDLELGREVAIKVLPAAVAEDPDRLRRFQQEARTASALNHPGIVTVHELGTHEGRPFLVLELLEGASIRERLERGERPDVATVVDWSAQIARALGAAHELGILHRDIKPENLFVTTDGTVKILDFGVAKLVSPPAEPVSLVETLAAGETAAGTLLGTAGYMAPEQVRGEEVDARADLFALGCVLYELLTGERAFGGDSAIEVLNAILKEEPPALGETEPAVPAPLARVVERCLAKDDKRRFRSGFDLAFALEQAVGTGATPEPRPEAGRAGGLRERLAWGVAVLAVIAALAAWIDGREQEPWLAVPLRMEIAPPETGGFENGIALSPDGRHLAFVAPGPSGEDVLWVRALADAESRRLPGSEGAAYPFWSPDGGQIAYFAKGRLRAASLPEGRSVTLGPAPDARGGAWSSRGEILLSLRGGGELTLFPAAGGDPKPLVTSGGDQAPSLLRFPTFLPDGRRAVLFGLAEDSPPGLWLADVRTGALRFLAEAESNAVFAPPDRLVYRSGGRLVARAFDPEPGRLHGPETEISEEVWSDASATMLTAISASDGRFLAFRAGGVARSRLLWYGRDGSVLGQLEPAGAFIEPVLSPDERRVAVSRMSEKSFSFDIWVFDLERGGLAPVTSRGNAATPLWSPDGRRVAYASFPDGEILAQSASGIGGGEVLFRGRTFSPLTDWLPDGQGLLVTALDLHRFTHEIWRLRLDGDPTFEPVITAPPDASFARLSPDGAYMAYQSGEAGAEEVFVATYPDLDRRWQISVAGGTQPRWRGDGRELYYVAPDRRIMAVATRTEAGELVASIPQPLFATQILPLVEARNHYDVTSDGQRFLVNSRLEEDASQPIVILADWQ